LRALHAGLGVGEALRDFRFEVLGLRQQLPPLARDRIPRLVGDLLGGRHALGLRRQLGEPRVGTGALLAVLVARRRAAAGLLEPLRERRRFGVLLPFGADEVHPFRARRLDLAGVSSPRSASIRSHIACAPCAAPRATPRGRAAPPARARAPGSRRAPPAPAR
jgi:hypothetical protein